MSLHGHMHACEESLIIVWNVTRCSSFPSTTTRVNEFVTKFI